MGVFDFFKKSGGNDLKQVVSPDRQNFLSQFLPEDEDKKRALARALMQGGAGMMIAGGPSMKPTNFLSALGAGVGTGVAGYDESLVADATFAKQRAAAQESEQKLQQAEQAAKLREGLFAGGDNGDMGYSIDQLKQYLQYQVSVGDDAGARDTLGMIQQLQQTGAKAGLTVGADGFEAAPGYNEGLGATERFKAGGRVSGEEAFRQTDDIREYNLYVEQTTAAGGQPEDFTTWMRAGKKAGATTVTVGQNSNKFAEKSDEEAAKRLATIVEAGSAAPQMVSDMEMLMDLGSKIGTGKVAEFKLSAGPYAEALGINIDGMAEAQAFQSITSRIAPNLRPAGAGATSDFDAKQYLASIPSLSRNPQGNAIIAQTMKGIAENKISAAEIASKAQRNEITWQEAEAEIRNLPNPYSGFKEFTSSIGDGGSSANPAGVVVSTQEQFEALPSGTTFSFDDDPPGTKRVKR
ncbi:hypothetical protein [Shinella sp.]|uniref:hypothetical protein n=1 Tax=Shinella sp. TaxID=1870904 RepID=UPI0040360FD1